MHRQRFYISIFLVAAALAAPRPAAAQQESVVDSLRSEVKILHARIDSLIQVLLTLEQKEGKARVQTELESLRAAAAAAAAAAGGAQPPQEDESFVGRERAQQALNPEISVTGDIVGFARTGSDGQRTVIPREFEFAFQAAIDPFARTKIFISHEEPIPLDPRPGAEVEEGGVEIEEGYAYWVGLPGGFSIDAGKFRQMLGAVNRWHTHALPEVERPLIVRELVGDDGLIQTGASLYWIAPIPGSTAFEFWFQLTSTTNDRLFPEAGSPSYLTHLNAFWDLSPTTYIQLGVTGLYAQDEDADNLRSRLAGLDLTYNWRPPARSRTREFTLRTEVFWSDRRQSDITEIARGGYAAAYYRLGLRWNAGLRFDLVEPFEGEQNTWQTAATLTYHQTGFLRIRGQWNHLDLGDQTDDQFLLQLIWAIGPHRDEIY